MNEQLKPYKTVEQIAKKHRLDVSFIQKQLDMGAPIEHEHTNNQKLAVEIALQHLDEIPDYYTRLKKMEASAKKEHKKFKDVKEDAVTDLQRGIVALDDASYNSIDSLMRRIMKKRKVTAKQLHNDFVAKHHQTPDTWAKRNMKEEKGLWDNIHARREKGLPRKKPGQKGYPKTLDIEEGLKQARKNVGASKCWPGKVATKTKIKDGEEVPDCRSIKEESGVRYCPKCEKNETRKECKYGEKYWDMFSRPITLGKNYTPNTPHPGNFPESFDHKIDPEKFKKVKDTSVAKKLRRMSTNQQGQLPKEMVKKVLKTDLPRFKEDVTIEDADGNTFIEIIDLIKPEPMKGIGEAKGCGGSPGQEYIDPNKNIKPSKPPKDFKKTLKNIIKNSPGSETPRGSIGEESSDQRPFSIAIKKITKRKKEGKLTPIQSAKALLQAGKHRTDEGKTLSQFMIEASAAWQRKEGKNPEGGLNKKGIASYRKEHPGSHLSLAVTTKPSKLKKGSKSANRRKSFCSRMSGMKAKLTSAKTANDPNSRINKSLRKWNC
jgi:hypothetical protein